MQPHLVPSPARSAVRRWGLRLLLSLSVGLSCWGVAESAHAAKQVVLTFDRTEVRVPLSVLEIYAQTGVASDQLSEFLGIDPEVQSRARDVLTREVVLSDRIVRQTLRGTTGEFVFSRLQRLLQSERTSRRRSDQPLRTAVTAAYTDDNRISLLELLQKYPEDEVRVDVRGLQETYNDVVGLIERFGPFLDLLRGSVQNEICDCAEPSASAPRPNAALPSTLLIKQSDS